MPEMNDRTNKYYKVWYTSQQTTFSLFYFTRHYSLHYLARHYLWAERLLLVKLVMDHHKWIHHAADELALMPTHYQTVLKHQYIHSFIL